LISKSDSRPYANAEIVLDSVKTVFFLYLVRLGGLTEFAAEDAVLLMGNYSVHVSDDAVRLLTIWPRHCLPEVVIYLRYDFDTRIILIERQFIARTPLENTKECKIKGRKT
jgi:hypothetical protein